MSYHYIRIVEHKIFKRGSKFDLIQDSLRKRIAIIGTLSWILISLYKHTNKNIKRGHEIVLVLRLIKISLRKQINIDEICFVFQVR